MKHWWNELKWIPRYAVAMFKDWRLFGIVPWRSRDYAYANRKVAEFDARVLRMAENIKRRATCDG